jgi:phosphinothricin acetyltransferase
VATIRQAQPSDVDAMTGIYNEAIRARELTYHAGEQAAEQVRRWLFTTEAYPACVVEEGARVVGWSALVRFHERAAYAPTVEMFTYVARAHRRRGHGKALVARMIDAARRNGFHSIVALALSSDPLVPYCTERAGFTKAGYLRLPSTSSDRLAEVTVLQAMVS